MSLKWDFPLRIEPHGVTNGLLRLKLDGIMLPKRALLFKLQYKKRTLPWNSFIFDYQYICKHPDDYINIRLDTDLYDYNICIRVTSTDDTLQKLKNKQKMHWFTWSNTINVNIPSLMKEHSFQINDWIRFKNPSNGIWTYGTVQEIIISTDTCTQAYIYKILHHHNSKVYEIRNPEIKKNVKRLTAHVYIDLTNQTDIENTLLIGDRIDINNEYVSDIYHLLNTFFYKQYVLTIKKEVHYDDLEIDYMSMSKSVALNVIDCLWIKQKGYKMKCLLSKSNGDHFNDAIKLIPQREYAVRRSIDVCRASIAQSTIYFCDVCLCRQGDYYYMFRCQREDKKKYDGHDMCLTCVYDTIKRYNKLVILLNDLLIDELTHDCIQTIVTYAAGSVVML